MATTRKITDLYYISFLVAAQCDVSCVKAAECYSENVLVIAHDKINRFLTRQSLTPETLWNEVKQFVEKRSGWLILDDTVIDNIHLKHIELTYYQWSGKHHKIVKRDRPQYSVLDRWGQYPSLRLPVYDKDGDVMSKNDYFRQMVTTAAARGFQPCFVMFDSWYSGIDNLKCVTKLCWNWFSRIKKEQNGES